MEIIFSPYFHFKRFPPLSHMHSSLKHALPLSKLDYSDPQTEPNGMIHTDAPRSRSRRSPELRRSTSITIAIAPIGVDRDHRNRRDCDRDLTDLARSVDREITIGAIAIVIDVDRRSFGDRRDRDRGASVWIVPFGSVCGSEQ